MKRAVFLFSLFFLVSGCGDSAPSDATVSGPADGSQTVALPTLNVNLIFNALDFTVNRPDGTALPDVEIEFFAGGNAFLSDANALPLADPNRLKTSTDDRGIGRVTATIFVPACVGTTDQTITGTVRGTVGTASHLWTETVTVTCSTGGT